MKSGLLFLLVFCASLSSFARSDVRIKEVHGDKARNIMEALAASGIELHMGDEFGSQPITLDAKDITCRYSIARFPDEWMSNARCTLGNIDSSNQELANPVALAKALQKYATLEGALGSRYLTVESVSCVLEYNTMDYHCTVKSTR